MLCNILLRRAKMLTVMRSVCVLQSGSSKNVAGILGNKIADIISVRTCVYSTRSKETFHEKPSLKNVETEQTTTPRKNIASPRITLMSGDSSLTVMTLEEARKLSKRRDLKLVKIVDVDHKTQRPVYKLMTGTEYFEEDLNRRKEKSLRKNHETKDPKLLTISSKISDHDLGSKLNNINKWLNKRHEVRIVINCAGNDEIAELICTRIEAETKHCGKMVQKRKKGDDLKFQLISLKKIEPDSKDKSAEESDAEKIREE